LTGLKATGEKIDLNQFKKPESDSSSTKSKKKRRRIVSNKGSAPQNNSGNSKFKPKARPSRTTKEEPSEEEVQRQIKETLEKLQGKSSKGKAAKYRKDKRDQHKQKTEEELASAEVESKTLKVTEFVTASEVATMMDVSVTEIISACMTLGMMVTMNQDWMLKH
jgi:translation initiation factor IF-2